MTSPTSMVDERIAERRREVREDRRRVRLRRTVTIAVLMLVLGVGYAIERSSLVALAEIRVSGTDQLPAEQVLAVADLPLGTSTLRLDLPAAEARVEELPRVRSANATRLDPLTVLIEVDERQPVLVGVSAGDTVLVDPDGVVIAEGQRSSLPPISLVQATPLPAPGDHVTASAGLSAGFTIHQELPAALRRRVERVVVHRADDVELVLAGDVSVRFGRADRIDEKARALAAVLEDVRDAPVTSIDVRAPATPVVRS